MRKIFLSLLIVSATVISVSAQVAMGLKGGLNFSNIDADEPFEDADSKLGYHFGPFLEFSFGDAFAIQPEVLFSTKGSDDDVNFSYLEVPVLLKGKFDMVNIHAGPQFGFLTMAERDGEDVEDFMKSTDVSVLAGAGINLTAGFVAGARYVWGLTNVWDENNVDVDVKNRTFQVYIGWKFGGPEALD